MFWWEKTVEYYFVQKHVDIENLIAPLDGKHENASDAIFSSDNKWLLIEFKRSVSEISSEIKKFRQYSIAKEALQSKDNHHLIIYGEPCPTDLIKLVARTYFSAKITELNSLYKSATEYKSFLMYLSQFIRLKTADKNGGTGHQYSTVVGISSKGEIAKLFTLEEYMLQLSKQRELKREFSIDLGPDQSRGRSR